MLVRNKRPFAVEIVATGDFVDAGDTVEVPDDVGESLVEQADAWEEASGRSRTSVPDVLSEVGDDPDKARTALAVENDHEKPRKSLVSRLEEIIASSEENG